MTKQSIGIGELKIYDNDIVISDPCFGEDDINSIILNNAMFGSWKCFATVNKLNCDDQYDTPNYENMYEISSLKLYSNFYDPRCVKYTREEINYIPINSGQIGIYNLSSYRNKDIVKDYEFYSNGDIRKMLPNEKDNWYLMNVDATLFSKYNCKIIPGGIVALTSEMSVSGFYLKDNANSILYIEFMLNNEFKEAQDVNDNLFNDDVYNGDDDIYNEDENDLY